MLRIRLKCNKWHLQFQKCSGVTPPNPRIMLWFMTGGGAHSQKFAGGMGAQKFEVTPLHDADFTYLLSIKTADLLRPWCWRLPRSWRAAARCPDRCREPRQRWRDEAQSVRPAIRTTLPSYTVVRVLPFPVCNVFVQKLRFVLHNNRRPYIFSWLILYYTSSEMTAV